MPPNPEQSEQNGCAGFSDGNDRNGKLCVQALRRRVCCACRMPEGLSRQAMEPARLQRQKADPWSAFLSFRYQLYFRNRRERLAKMLRIFAR